MLWPNGLIAYELDTAFTADEVAVLNAAFAEYRRRTCVRFEKRRRQHDYLYITKGLGCYSQVGRTGGRQEVSLGRGCLFHEIVVHELMHAVGFWHEHSRAGHLFLLPSPW
uniref:Metalloendopeptidase n=1 Tax=Ascaris lumbricoides TaxID=6252 RepID=A0A0M3IUU2_ASCLU